MQFNCHLYFCDFFCFVLLFFIKTVPFISEAVAWTKLIIVLIEMGMKYIFMNRFNFNMEENNLTASKF